MALTSRLSSGLPGTRTGPSWPPFMRLSRVSICRPPILAWTWQLKQFFASKGRTLASKNSLDAAVLGSDCAMASAVANPTHANPSETPISLSNRDRLRILPGFKYCQPSCQQCKRPLDQPPSLGSWRVVALQSMDSKWGPELMIASPAAVASYWHNLAACYPALRWPLRPSSEDIRFMKAEVAKWVAAHSESEPNVLLLGVTPEI